MTDIKDKLIDMVKVQDISSIDLMADSLGIQKDEVRETLLELTESGQLSGYLTDDGNRYFRKDIRPSQRPTIPQDAKQPDFLDYDTRPGKIVAVIGLAIVIAALILLSQAGGDLSRENIGTVILLAGLLIMMGGCYYIGRRQTP